EVLEDVLEDVDGFDHRRGRGGRRESSSLVPASFHPIPNPQPRIPTPITSVPCYAPSRSEEASMNRLTIAVVALVSVPLSMALVPTSNRPEDVGFASERLQRIHEAVQRHLDAKELSGVVTLVARKGRVAHHEAHGLMDIESKKPMPKDGIFR